MKHVIKELLREGLLTEVQMKTVSTTYLEGLLNNVHNNLAKQFLTNWIKRGVNNSVMLSGREYHILGLIKAGGIIPKQFHPKN